MKQKIIFIVLLVVTMYIPAPSKECGKITRELIIENLLNIQTVPTQVVEEEDTSMLPASLFSTLL